MGLKFGAFLAGFLSLIVINVSYKFPHHAQKNIGKGDTVVIIFKNFPWYKKFLQVSPGFRVENDVPVITLIDEFHKQFIEPEAKLLDDTLRVKVQRNYVLLRHTFNTISSFDYLLSRGDTITFSYDAGIPMANLRSKAYDINLELNWKKRFQNGSFTPYEMFLYPFFPEDSIRETGHILGNRDACREKNYVAAIQWYLDERKWLDSLHRTGALSDAVFNFYDSKCIYLVKKINEEGGKGDETEVEAPTIDACTVYSYYYDFLESVVKRRIEARVQKLRLANGNMADYRKVYEEIEQSGIASPYKDLLLQKYLALIAENFPAGDFAMYYARFRQFTHDSALVDQIRSTYLMDFARWEGLSDSLFLLDPAKKRSTFRDVIAASKGKVIYIDFWASWCAPCREEMPYTRELRKRYADKKVEFVYLSIDRNFDAWKSANRAERLPDYPNTYLVLNPARAQLLKELALESIPRYLLIDPNGRIVDKDAPGPQNHTLHERIQRLLK